MGLGSKRGLKRAIQVVASSNTMNSGMTTFFFSFITGDRSRSGLGLEVERRDGFRVEMPG
ncbi:hypothetical protein BL241_17100 [Ralstonia solanacearum]|nr:hypothetical protein AC251_17585 [Ralstonia pseudosolanacearum]OIT10474.1 hypothetical protein BL241_17100 [Ralstonia solanacearum]